MQLIIISGLSGSGKSIALNVLADSDFYCVDNLPAELLIDTVAHLRRGGTTKAALTIDARTGESLSRLPAALDALKADHIDVRLVFLDARQDSLLRRFSETRRRHPLASGESTIEECIERERELLESIATLGQRIDTSDLNPNALRQWMKDLLQLGQSGMTLVFESFGFKQGIPLDADFVFDVRFLPNPHYDPKLRALTGHDLEVVRFLDSIPEAGRLEADIRRFLATWLPAFVRDNRASLTIAIGCTGGQHRSVYLVERLARHFQGSFYVLRRHRQLLKAS
jgi:RNase adapter protein RapZ